jgi:gamma-glutamyl-gamma-aminobutyrate hydrolase PuuD
VARPIVGITTYVLPARFGVWDLESALLPATYVAKVERAGARPLLVPPSTDGVEETLDALDGLLLSGGSDIDPELYGHPVHQETKDVVRLRDDGELALLRGALARDLPVLAICRGFQLLNVLRGGDLVQHLPEAVGHERHRETLGVFSEHPVEVRGGTLLASIIGERHEGVMSSHHQGVSRVGEGLVETAWAEDGTLEGVEDPSKRFTVGVLWHPEMEEEDKRLFEALVAAARRLKATRRATG